MIESKQHGHIIAKQVKTLGPQGALQGKIPPVSETRTGQHGPNENTILAT